MKVFVGCFIIVASAMAMPQRPDEAGSADEEAEMISYEVLKNYDSYELRKYPASKWICTKDVIDETGEDPFKDWREKYENAFEVMSTKLWSERPESKMFQRLFRYIFGVNKNSEKIEMTRPVTTRVSLKSGISYNYEMCFWSGSPYENKELPEPFDDSVYIQNRPEMEVVVRRFGCWAISDEDWESNRQALMEDVSDNSELNLLADSPMFVGYNSPFSTVNRRNEIWIENKINLQESLGVDFADQ